MSSLDEYRRRRDAERPRAPEAPALCPGSRGPLAKDGGCPECALADAGNLTGKVVRSHAPVLAIREVEEVSYTSCLACGGKGWGIFNEDVHGEPEVQRCDDCKRFREDQDAAALPEAVRALEKALRHWRADH